MKVVSQRHEIDLRLLRKLRKSGLRELHAADIGHYPHWSIGNTMYAGDAVLCCGPAIFHSLSPALYARDAVL